jgi:hypothetical protein
VGSFVIVPDHWNIGGDERSRKDRDERIRSVVNDRNRLVHGIKKDFDLGLSESCEELAKWLDSAHVAALVMAREVDEIREAIDQGLKISKVSEVRDLMVDPNAEPPEEIRIPGTEITFTLDSRVP